MNSFSRSSGLIATVLGTCIVGIGAAVMPAQTEGAALANVDRIGSAASLDANYLTVAMPFRQVSQLCRIPIEIGMWNSRQPGRCA